MDKAQLTQAAKAITARNMTKGINAAVLVWHEREGTFGLNFYTSGALTDSEIECCELAAGELYSEVWQTIKQFSTQYSVGWPPTNIEPKFCVVYTRPNNSFKPDSYAAA